MLLLRDPLALSGQIAMLPQALGPALALCDGTRTLYGIRVALMLQFRLQVDLDVLAEIVETLDQLCLLENERSAAAEAAALAAYRAAPYRPPASAGASYPADPGELRALLDGYLAGVRGKSDRRRLSCAVGSEHGFVGLTDSNQPGQIC